MRAFVLLLFKIIRLSGIRIKLYYQINKIKFWSMGVSYGKNLKVSMDVQLYLAPNAQFKIGDNCIIKSGGGLNPIGRNLTSSFYLTPDSKIIIGNNVGMSNVAFRCDSQITIEDSVILGAGVIVSDTNSHSLNYLVRGTSQKNENGILLDRFETISKPVTIKRNAFVGMHSIVLKGVTIGERSVIGAGSVVSKDIPADCIAAGNPCKIIKYLK